MKFILGRITKDYKDFEKSLSVKNAKIVGNFGSTSISVLQAIEKAAKEFKNETKTTTTYRIRLG